jgi:SAM-dependent methyltransferase
MKTRLAHDELWPGSLPDSFLNRAAGTAQYLSTQKLNDRKIADCGEDNPLKNIIRERLGVEIATINWDFNHSCPLDDKFDVILCFEVLEHLFNPLLFLESVRELLNDDGVIYLSTPYHRPQLLRTLHHYHEIPSDRIMWLFDAAGLKVEEAVKINTGGKWYKHLYGIRPVLRYFQKTRLYKLTK